MQVLQVIVGFDIEALTGGGAMFGVELSRELSRLGVEVCLAGLWDYGTENEKQRIFSLNQEGIQTFTLAPWNPDQPLRSLWSATQSLRLFLQQKKINLIHSHNEFCEIASAFQKISGVTPALVRTVHLGHRLEWPKRPIRRLLFTSFLYPFLFDYEIGVSQNIVDNLNRRFWARILKRNALKINNGLRLERFTEPLPDPALYRDSLGIPPAAYVIGSVGRLTEYKAYEDFISAAALVKTEIPQAHFVLVGEGNLRAELHNQVHELGLAERFHFLGPRADIPQVLACFDLFVSSSIAEGLPTVLLESMAAGIPIVATDILGTRELINDQINGCLAPPRNPHALAQMIIKTSQNSDLRVRLASNARQTVQGYAMQTIAARHIQLYQSIIVK
jgi:glycosyltransferase involved in cell wall biosynthesis